MPHNPQVILSAIRATISFFAVISCLKQFIIDLPLVSFGIYFADATITVMDLIGYQVTAYDTKKIKEVTEILVPSLCPSLIIAYLLFEYYYASLFGVLVCAIGLAPLFNNAEFQQYKKKYDESIRKVLVGTMALISLFSLNGSGLMATVVLACNELCFDRQVSILRQPKEIVRECNLAMFVFFSNWAVQHL